MASVSSRLRPLRVTEDWTIEILDQTRLPGEVTWQRLTSLEEAAEAIRDMRVRGAPLIGITAAYGLALAVRADPGNVALEEAISTLRGTRPTAVNLANALSRVARAVARVPAERRASRALAEAAAIADEAVAACRAIGAGGRALLQSIRPEASPDAPVRILTHCNAGALATLELGTALAPIYCAHAAGIPVEVIVDETRPRGQGWLTAWELGREGIRHVIIPDTATAHVLQRGRVDLVIVGTDRTTPRGDVCNKIGTLGVALAARAAGVPFYAAVPTSSVDWTCADWRTIPIEERDPEEVRNGRTGTVALSPVWNPAFDVTPADLVTGLITEAGVVPATEAGVARLKPSEDP